MRKEELEFTNVVCPFCGAKQKTGLVDGLSVENIIKTAVQIIKSIRKNCLETADNVFIKHQDL